METVGTTARGRGRPRQGDGTLRRIKFQVCLSKGERDQLQAEAEAHGYDYAAEWIRAVAIPRRNANGAA